MVTFQAFLGMASLQTPGKCHIGDRVTFGSSLPPKPTFPSPAPSPKGGTLLELL